jgi:hypothetical protein
MATGTITDKINNVVEKLEDQSFDLLSYLGFSRAEIDAANTFVCGAMTPEGVPHVKPEHYAVFDCANPCGRTGKRFLAVDKPRSRRRSICRMMRRSKIAKKPICSPGGLV